MKGSSILNQLPADAPFRPTMTVSFLTPEQQKAAAGGDRRDGLVYVYTDQIIMAVNVAIATDRPVLLRGPSGSGKSSLARNVARWLKWRYYEQVISSRTEARDLLWQFDTIRRLGDAQTSDGVQRDVEYIEPGILWWAFDRERARRRGLAGGSENKREPVEPPGDHRDNPRAVVLLDEIDKADPDVPNNLLVPLGSHEFTVPHMQLEDSLVKAVERPLVMMTTNDERELPAAFLRRCIIVELSRPDETQLVTIASAQFGPEQVRLYRRVASALAAGDADRSGVVEVPSTAEYLDAVSACLKLGITPSSPLWEALSGVALFKPRGPTGAL